MNTDIRLTPNFHLREFLKNGSDEGVTAEIVENLRHLAQKLEEVRKLCGDKPITITSGFRTLNHNKAVGGAKNSQHLYGRAADIIVKGLAPKEVQNLLKDKWEGGLGYGATFTHLDTRGFRARFNYA